MMFKKLKEKKTIGMIFVLSFAATLTLGAFSVFAQQKAEHDVENMPFEINEDGIEETYENEFPDLPYKNYVSEKTGKQVCEKFGLDFETVSLTNMSEEMLDYGSALEYLNLSKESSLLSNESTPAIIDSVEEMPLEIQLNEGYAFGGAEAVITNYCTTQNIDPKSSKVGDLSIEQLFEICKLTRKASPHDE